MLDDPSQKKETAPVATNIPDAVTRILSEYQFHDQVANLIASNRADENRLGAIIYFLAMQIDNLNHRLTLLEKPR
jgi:hypothetical protein